MLNKLIKICCVVFLFILLIGIHGCNILNSDSGNEFETIFELKYNKTGMSSYVAHDIIEVSDGGYLIVGRGGGIIFLLRLDEGGNILWENDYAGTIVYSLIQTVDGGFAFCGKNNNGVYILKTNTLGEVEWDIIIEMEYCSPAQKIIQTISGDLVILANSYEVSTNSILIRMSITGEIIWQTTLDRWNSIRFISQFENNNEELLILGYNFFEDHKDYWLTKLDQNGNELSRTSIDTDIIGYYEVWGEPRVFIDENNRFVGCSRTEFLVLDDTGNLIMQSDMTPTNIYYDNVYIRSINQFNNYYLLAGSLVKEVFQNGGYSNHYSGAIFRLNAQGDIIWDKNICPENNEYSMIRSSIISNNSFLITAGNFIDENEEYGYAWIKKMNVLNLNNN